MNIVMLDRATFAPDIRFETTPLGPCVWREHAVTAAAELVERARDAAVVVTNKLGIDASALGRLRRLRLIAVAATGVDHIDLDAARDRGVAVCNVAGYAVTSVPEHVFALILALRRQLLGYTAAAIDGRWSAAPVFCLHDFAIHDLDGSVLGIVGGGGLGTAVARIGAAFGMRVLFAEHRAAQTLRAGYTRFDDVLGAADVLSLHVPLTADTRHLIGAHELGRMKRSALLINTARGGVVDEAALLTALRGGRLGGAALDVLDGEPPRADHPLLKARLPNLLITPHIAWASHGAQQRLADEIIANIAAFARGERRNRVD